MTSNHKRSQPAIRTIFAVRCWN